MTTLTLKLPGSESDVTTRLAAFESWLGRKPGMLLAFLADQHWTNDKGEFLAAGYFAPRYAKADLPILWSVPLCPNDKTLADPMGEVIAGKRDAEFARCAKVLAGFRPQDERVPIRLGWECNGTWYRWSEDAAKYVQAFQRVAGIFRQASSRFQVVWNINAGSPYPARYWPGSEVVDVPSVDAYDHNRAGIPLADLDLTRRHNAPWAIDEWAADANRHQFIEAMADYIERHQPLWHGYWDSTSGFKGAVSTRDSGSTGYAFKARFGGNSRVAELEQRAASSQAAVDRLMSATGELQVQLLRAEAHLAEAEKQYLAQLTETNAALDREAAAKIERDEARDLLRRLAAVQREVMAS